MYEENRVYSRKHCEKLYPGLALRVVNSRNLIESWKSICISVFFAIISNQYKMLPIYQKLGWNFNKMAIYSGKKTGHSFPSIGNICVSQPF